MEKVRVHPGETEFDRITRNIQLKVLHSDLRSRGLMAPVATKVELAKPGYSFGNFVPRSHLIGLGVYHVMETMCQWRQQHPKRKTVPWSEVEKWMEDTQLTIPIEFDSVTDQRDRRPGRARGPPRLSTVFPQVFGDDTGMSAASRRALSLDVVPPK